MFIIAVDLKGALKKGCASQFLLGLRGAAFGKVPPEIVKENDLVFDRDCIAIHLSIGPKSLLGKILKPVLSGNVPGFLAFMLFSAKKVYIPHSQKLITAIAEAAAEYMRSCGMLKSGTKVAAWGMPLHKGKWADKIA